MADLADIAQGLEERHRSAALARLAGRGPERESLHHCTSCGERIEEARRAAVKGCRTCAFCQEQIERGVR